MLTKSFILMDEEGSNRYVGKVSCNIHKNTGFVEEVYCEISGSHSGIAKIQVLWDVTPCELVIVTNLSKDCIVSIFRAKCHRRWNVQASPSRWRHSDPSKHL